jgi:formate hydrogenlyase transcriptional activator
MADHVISPPEAAIAAPFEHSRRLLEALLEVSEAIAHQRDLPALFHDLAGRLHSVVEFDFLTLVLHDSERNVMRLHVLETHIPTDKVTGRESPVENNPSGWVLQTQQPFVVDDIEQESRFPEFIQRVREHGVRSIALVPLTTAQRRLGAMGFGRLTPQRITEAELQFMQRVASQVAVAVDNALNFESSQAYQQQLARQRDRLQALLEINNALVTSRELAEVFRSIVSTLKRVIHHDYTSLALLDPVTGLLKIHALDFPGRPGLIKEETTVSMDDSPSGRCFSNGQPLLLQGAEIDRFHSETIRILRQEGVETICCVPLITHGRTFGTLNLASRRADAFSASDVELLQQVAAQIAIAAKSIS